MRVKADPGVFLFWTNHLLLVAVACFIINVLACTYVDDPSQSVIQALAIFSSMESIRTTMSRTYIWMVQPLVAH